MVIIHVHVHICVVRLQNNLINFVVETQAADIVFTNHDIESPSPSTTPTPNHNGPTRIEQLEMGPESKLPAPKYS